MIVEFIGLPGAGKSTYIDPLIDRIREKGIPADNFSAHNNKLMGSLYGKAKFMIFYVRNLGPILKLRSHILKNSVGSSKISGRITKLIILVFSIHYYQRRSSGNVLVMDQGIIQMLVSLFIDRRDEAESDIMNAFGIVKEILEKAPYKTIKIELPIETAAERIDKRNKRNCEFKLMDIESLKDNLRKYEKLLSAFKAEVIVDSQKENIQDNISIIYNSFFENEK